ncbi:MAG: hypothetical protein K0Q99_2329 [Clostridia bacterium]|jgi:hypothetical protein|nr:hypothetical protein [Clostridia bacterium]
MKENHAFYIILAFSVTTCKGMFMAKVSIYEPFVLIMNGEFENNDNILE